MRLGDDVDAHYSVEVALVFSKLGGNVSGE